MYQLTTIDGRFQLNGEEVFLRSGEYHYFRVPPVYWESDLRRLRDEAHFNAISTYIPWSFHEPKEGTFTFDGGIHPQSNLLGFLQLCRKLELPVIIRPGPFIYAEFRGLGIPLWVGEQYPEVVARHPDGSLDKGEGYYNVSLNHPQYLSLVKKWYKTLISAIDEYFDDPIICMQLDNETGLMYNFNVGRMDFNDSTVELFHEWLEKEFGDPQTLSVFCLESYLTFDEITPPKNGLNVAKSMIWQSFFEDWVIRYLEYLRDTAAELGVPVIFLNNEQGFFFNPTNPIKKVELASLYGYNVSMKITRSRFTQNIPFGNSIVPSIFKGFLDERYQPLFASEMGCGWFDPRVKVSPISTAQLMLGSIAHGVKGINMYVARDGEDIEGEKYHYHSMLDHRSRKLPRFEVVQEIYAFTAKYGEELTNSEEIYDNIGYATYAMNHRIIPGDFFQKGKEIRPIKIIAMLAEYGLYGLLLANGFNPEPFSLEKTTLKDLKHINSLIIHNRGAIEKGDYNKLLDYVKQGGHLLSGPTYPVMNEHGFPLNTSKLFPAVVSKEHLFGKIRNRFRIFFAKLRYKIQRARLRRYNKYALYHLDRNEQLNILRKWAPRGPKVRTMNDRKIQLAYSAKEFTWQREDIEPLMWLHGKPIAYRHTLKKGTNTVIGTPLGGRYMVEAFYTDSEEQKENKKDFLNSLLARNGVEKTFEATVELEIIGRKNSEKQSLFLFLLNRGHKKKGIVKVLIPAKTGLPKNTPLHIEHCYSFDQSHVEEKEITLEKFSSEGLQFHIQADDSLVLRISPKTD